MNNRNRLDENSYPELDLEDRFHSIETEDHDEEGEEE